MRVIYSDDHKAHSPQAFLSRGVFSNCPEVPERAEILVRAINEIGFNIEPPREFGLVPVRRVHDAQYTDFLANAWDRWSELRSLARKMHQ